jgi:magnesium-transporting ATPase (P-type)
VAFAKKGGIDVAELRQSSPRRGEIPFSASAKMMATEHGDSVYLKGAPEPILDLCGTLDTPARAALHAEAERMAARALRVLAIAVVEGATLAEAPSFDALRGRAKLLGLVGQIDPPREEAREAVKNCRSAGIRTVMITGDHKVTGQAIARDLGILREGDVALDDRQLARLSDRELDRELDRVAVFARIEPAQKLRIIDLFQKRGEIVAMTGDGVNDAPALARANVGVAMGVTGTDVAKQASDIVVTDDNFATIAAAVEEGRVVYRNLKKAILLLLSSSLAQVVVLLAAISLGYATPLLAVHILWINLITEGPITVNLAIDPKEGNELSFPPVPPNQPILTRRMALRLFLMSTTIAVSTLCFFVVKLESRDAARAGAHRHFHAARRVHVVQRPELPLANALGARPGHPAKPLAARRYPDFELDAGGRGVPAGFQRRFFTPLRCRSTRWSRSERPRAWCCGSRRFASTSHDGALNCVRAARRLLRKTGGADERPPCLQTGKIGADPRPPRHRLSLLHRFGKVREVVGTGLSDRTSAGW